MTGVFLTVFALFWTGMVLAFNGFMGHGIYKQYEAQHFLTTTGTISHSELTSSRGSKGGTSYGARVEYSYHVDGQLFTGDTIRFGMHSSNHTSASSIVNAHPIGSEVQIYYNPADAHESLLNPGVQGSDLMGLIFMTPFNMVMFGLWLGIGGWLRERWFKPVAGGVKIMTDGSMTRIRLPQFPAISWGIITTGGLGFVSIFAVGISTNMEPSIDVALTVLAGIYIAGIAVFLWQRQKISTGIDDLVINEASRTIELPLTFDRKERITVGIGDIKSLSVEKTVHRSSKGGISYTYEPTLCLESASPSIQKLADWSDEMKAKAFADWLRQKLNPNLPATMATEVVADENEAKETAIATAREKEFEEMRRDGKSRIKVSDGPEGREFYFPAARNIGIALFLTLFMFFFTGTAVALFYFHAPMFFSIVFGIVGVLMIFGVFNMWFRSVRMTVNSTTVRVKKSWLIFSRTRDFSADDYVRFTTKPGMQSGSTIFTDIRLVRAGADSEFAQDLNKYRNVKGVDPLVAERFRQAAGPSGVTVASSIANSAEAEWLVREMNQALGQGQLRPAGLPNEITARPEVISTSAKSKIALLVPFIFLVIAGSFVYDFWQHTNSISTRPLPVKSTATNTTSPQLAIAVAFSSCGQSEEPQTNGYLVKAEGHADWFVCKVSGRLKTIEMKIEPVAQGGGKLLLSFFGGPWRIPRKCNRSVFCPQSRQYQFRRMGGS